MPAQQREKRPQVKIQPVGQAEVERRTGLSREVLRKWEQRYHFPTPVRGLRGQRQYHASEVERLELVSRLLKQGLRVGALVPKSTAQLKAMLHAHRVAQTLPAAPEPDTLGGLVHQLLDALATRHNPDAVAIFLQDQISRFGLETFAAHLMPSFNCAVGEDWQAGRLSVAAEHHYTASLRQVVLRALPPAGQATSSPRVLLTTPPTELHSQGLLALLVQLRLHGASCVDLDTQTPLEEVLTTVRTQHIDIVAISMSACMPVMDVHLYVRGLQSGLPETCALWLGGQGCAALEPKDLQRCEVFTDTASAVRRWLTLAGASHELE